MQETAISPASSVNGAFSSSFSARCFSAVRAATRLARYRVTSRSRRISGGGTKLGRSICRSATLHSQTASSLSSPN
jgi:hypothetical protein